MRATTHRTARSAATLFVLAGAFCIAGPLATPAAALSLQPSSDQAPAPTMQRGQALFNEGDRAGAIEVFRAITESQPNNAGAWFWLGYTLHADGQLDDAIVAHERAASFTQPAQAQVRRVALYNLGCAHALKGDADEAFIALRRSIDAGMGNPNDQWGTDTDLESLHDDPRWEALMKRLESPGAMPRLLRFWVGDWDVYSTSGQVSGRNTLTLRVAGTVIHEAWTPTGGGPPGESWNWFDHADGTWHQVWVSGSGLHTHFVGNPLGAGILFEGDQVQPSGNISRIRMHVRPIDGGRVQQTGTQYDEASGSWQPRYDLIYVPTGEPFEGSQPGETDQG